jgi:hypothetical protein
MRWIQRFSSLCVFVYAAGWLKLSPEVLAMVGVACGFGAGQTVTGFGQVDISALKKLDAALRSMPPPSNRPPPLGP